HFRIICAWDKSNRISLALNRLGGFWADSSDSYIMQLSSKTSIFQKASHPILTCKKDPINSADISYIFSDRETINFKQRYNNWLSLIDCYFFSKSLCPLLFTRHYNIFILKGNHVLHPLLRFSDYFLGTLVN